jgi:peptide/nickel transport system substrate-binding protein
LTLYSSVDVTVFDPALEGFNYNIIGGWMERLFADNWLIAPSDYNFSTAFRPADYEVGGLASDWEFTDPNTFVAHLRQGIYWQNLPPANGREFVASDVVAHYTRWYNPTTGGYTVDGPHATSNYLADLTSITAPDKFTVVFKWSIANPDWVYECLMLSGTAENSIECPDAVALYGSVNDWHHAIGTGPFILTDFVDNSSATMVANPNYWGHDERYPQNKLPYVQTVKYLIIPDSTTALAALRTGKLDNLDGATIQQSQAVASTNPQIIRTTVPSIGEDIDPRMDTAPFNDVRVRQAMQQSLDLGSIAKDYYQGFVSPNPDSLTSQYMTGWGFPYSQWPQTLQAQFAYNPTNAKALLAAAGYPNGFNTSIVVDQYFDTSLLAIVQSDFAAVGINMSIQVLPFPSYNSLVGTQHKQTALNAGSAGNIGKTTEPISEIGKYITTNSTNSWGFNDPTYNAFYTQAQNATSLDAVKAALLGANQYLLQIHFPISLLQTVTVSLTQPSLHGYYGQNDAFTGSYGPTCLGFYSARCWLTQ